SLAAASTIRRETVAENDSPVRAASRAIVSTLSDRLIVRRATMTSRGMNTIIILPLWTDDLPDRPPKLPAGMPMTGSTLGDMESPWDDIKEMPHVPSHQHERRGVQRAPQPGAHEQHGREIDGAPQLRLPHQPCRGRRRRPCHERED